VNTTTEYAVQAERRPVHRIEEMLAQMYARLVELEAELARVGNARGPGRGTTGVRTARAFATLSAHVNRMVEPNRLVQACL
jgi:hypothetical protein